MGDAANGVVSGVKLVGENVGVGVDHAKEIVEGVRDGVDFRGRKAFQSNGGGFQRQSHGRTLSVRHANCVAVDGGDDGVLKGSRGDLG